MLCASAVGLISYDETGQCIYCNEAVCQIIGAFQNQLMAQNYNTLSSWNASGMIAMARDVMLTGNVATGEFKFYNKF